MPKNDLVIKLKKFAKDREIYDKHLRGIEFKDLSDNEAEKLIEKCQKTRAAQNGRNAAGDGPNLDPSKVVYSQNYEKKKGDWSTVELTDEELQGIRENHKQDCKKLMDEIQKDYDDPVVQTALFTMRADKIYTRIKAALREKVRLVRNGN